ncbi:hypothetical protein J2129_000054 [Methanofollis sp. W23]|nr:hypothetical protein [Methanofollis sp. W23]
MAACVPTLDDPGLEAPSYERVLFGRVSSLPGRSFKLQRGQHEEETCISGARKRLCSVFSRKEGHPWCVRLSVMVPIAKRYRR